MCYTVQTFQRVQRGPRRCKFRQTRKSNGHKDVQRAERDLLATICEKYMGLGRKPVFVHLTRIGLVTRQRQFGFHSSWGGFLGICPRYRYHEHMPMVPVPWAYAPMLMVPVPWAYAHGTGTMGICPWYWYHGHMPIEHMPMVPGHMPMVPIP